MQAGHPFAVATHDEVLLRAVLDRHPDAMRADGVEVEMLYGLGTELLDTLRAEGYRTREYVVFGDQWWLYVLNRVAERPERVYRALRRPRGLVTRCPAPSTSSTSRCSPTSSSRTWGPTG